jgi:branched-chain amino acid transport system substrate-binding protein
MIGKRTLIGAAIALALFACASAKADEHGVTADEIVIGASMPLTGISASIGQGQSIGLRVAIAEVNAAGGINGRKVRAVIEDDGYVPARIVQNVHKLIDVDGIFALMGTSSSAGTLAVVDYLTETKTLLINSLVMNSAIWDTSRPTIFTVGQGYPVLAGRVVGYMTKQDPSLKWGIFAQDDAFGENILVGVLKALGEAKPALVIKYKRGQQDFSAEMLRMKDAGVTAIYSGAVFNEHVVLTREARRLNMPVKFGLLFTAHNALLQKLMGAPGQDALTSDTVSTMDEPGGRQFLELAKRYIPENELGAIERDTLTSYAGASVLFDALKRCGKDLTTDCAVSQLEATKDFKTPSMGPITFGPGVRFSNQKIRVIRSDFEKSRFVPITEYE